MQSDVLIFYVNGRKVEESNPSPGTTLLQFLRQKLHLTGTKNACNQGGCGACTVMLSKFYPEDNAVRHTTVNACITPLCSIHGYALTTVEGVGNSKKGLHPIQESLSKNHGLQCGFCTPGMVMSLYCLLRNKTYPSQVDVERVLEGNLCRCTGYRPIIDAMKPFYDCPMGEECCKNKTNSTQDTDQTSKDTPYKPQDPSQAVIFPPELKKTTNEKSVVFRSGKWTWIRPLQLKEVVDIKARNKEARLVLGATSLVYKLKNGQLSSGTLICCTEVREMNFLSMTSDGVEIGAAVTINKLHDFFQSKLPLLSGGNAQMVHAFLECTRWIAVDQVRNSATIGGHVVYTDPLSDMNPLLMAVGAEIKVMSSTGKTRRVTLDEKFFIQGFQTPLANEDIVVSVFIPFEAKEKSPGCLSSRKPVQKSVHTQFFKQPPRRGYSYAIVNAACQMALTDDNKIETLRMCFGGVGNKTFLARKCSDGVKGRSLSETTVTNLIDILSEELLGANKELDKYNLTLACSFVFKFFCGISVPQNQEQDVSAIDKLSYKPCESAQVFEDVPETQPQHDAVGRPVPHMSGRDLLSGEAMFLDDIPRYENELFVYPVLSTKAHANITKVDVSAVLNSPGVFEFIDHSKVPGSNKFGIIAKDEELFASEKVEVYGQLIGGIVAESREQAEAASRLINIQYEDLKPIITLEDAIEAGSFYAYESAPLKRGDIDTAFTNADQVIEGKVQTSAQDHMYMETISALVIPKHEQNEMEVYAGTQNTTSIQGAVSEFLEIPRNRILVRQKRTGGAFGGKETGSLRAVGPAAVGAAITGRPTRCVFDRKQNFHNAGKSHPYLIRYKVACTKDGQITALKLDLYSNGGFSLDLTSAVMDLSLLAADGCYNIPNMLVTGYICKTNTYSNTAFRGFGGPQAVFGIETVISEVAHALGKKQEEIRELNMYTEGDTALSTMELTNCNIRKCWTDCEKQSNIETKREQILEFNRNSKWKKRGIAMMPIKFPVGYFLAFLNQGSCLLHVYLDGTISLTHGGCECGQGLNTKVIQIASRALGVPTEKIYTSETSTGYSINTTATSGSTTTDIIGAAVLNACNELQSRLKPLKDNMPNAVWEQLIPAAYFSRISLSVIGFGTPDAVGWDAKEGKGKPCNYYTFGAACTSVEIDCLTGEHQILSTDMVMDVGKSLNPGIDIGQIEGGFMQGYGRVTLEEIKHKSNGVPLSNGPLNYKIPGVRNIPREFRVSLLKDHPNPKAIYSSKGIGEPPMLLATSVYLAIKEAVTAFRSENGMKDRFEMNCPLTTERIRMACEDRIAKKVLQM